MLKGKVERDHYWYDRIRKVMFHGRGGKLEYNYDPISKRSVPSVVEHEEEMWQNDYPLLKEWVESNKDEYGFEVDLDTGKNIFLTVDVRRFEDMARNLFENNIVSDHDAVALHREIKDIEEKYGKLDSHNRRRPIHSG